MPAKMKYAFLCDGAMLVHGKWTYQGLFGVINCIAFPTMHREAVLAMHFTGPVGAHMLRVQFADSKGKAISPEARQAIECLEFQDNWVTINLQGIPLPTEGFYSFKIYLDDEKEAFGSVDFSATLIRSKPPGPPPH